MTLTIIIVASFLALTLLVGLLPRRGGAGRRDYVLGGGRAGAFLLLATMAATNFSAFTVFGLSGAGYRMGWAYYPAIGFGTGLMALSFILVGMPLRRLSKERGYLSPADFIADRYGSRPLALGFSLAQCAITLPYLATQAVAGGRMLELLTGLPYPLCSLLIVAVTALYTLRGGFRAVAATDVLQLGVLAGGAAIAFAAILGRSGGLAGAASRLAELSPAHLARPGAGEGLSLSALGGTWFLWLLADPLFPQLFQRFYAARDDATLAKTAALYPLVTGGLFFLTVGVGVVGASLMPGLRGKETEQVFTLLAADSGDALLGAAFVLAALAALMSTMDSQLLSLSSIIVEDFLPLNSARRGTAERGAASGADRRAIAALAAAAWLASLAPPTLILDFLTGLAFPGYAALAPIVYAGLYSKRIGAGAAAFATAAGLTLVALEAAGALQTGTIPAVALNAAVQAVLLALPTLARRPGRKSAAGSGWVPERLFSNASPAWLLAVAAVVAFALEPWTVGSPPRVALGAPAWVWRSAASCGALALVFALWRKPKGPSARS